jgi:hypothetical protein
LERRKEIKRKRWKEKKRRAKGLNNKQPNSKQRDLLEKLIVARPTNNKIKINGKGIKKNVENEKMKGRSFQIDRRRQSITILFTITCYTFRLPKAAIRYIFSKRIERKKFTLLRNEILILQRIRYTPRQKVGRFGIRIPVDARESSLLPNVQNGSAAQPAHIQ